MDTFWDDDNKKDEIFEISDKRNYEPAAVYVRNCEI